MNLTYRELAAQILEKMGDNELDTNVTVYVRDMDEYFPIESIKITGGADGVLDEGHPVLFTPKD